MNFLIVFAVIAVVAMVIIAALTNNENRRSASQRKERDQTPIKKTQSILSSNEQMTFLKLRKALPNYIVITRVALSALINSSGLVTRNKINRCCVDFVVLDKGFKVISIVEVDSPNKNGNVSKISERDTMLMEAGYSVVRYAHSPDIERITSDFSIFLHSQKTGKNSQFHMNLQNSNHRQNEDNFFDHDY
jgi:very-short-patch-repair endonuclease